jgi:Flp pilus assembly protein TadD
MEDHSTIEEYLLEATRLAEGGEEGRALEVLLGIEQDHAEDATLLCMIGALAAHAGADGMASDFFRRCLEQEPMDPQLLITAGAGLAALGDPAAEPALRLAALTAPDMPPARMHYGRFLVRGGMVEAGLEELEAARSLDPGDALIRGEVGIAYLLSGRGGAALAEFEVAVAAAPDDVDLRLLYGLALIQDDDIPAAAEELYPLSLSMADDPEVQALLALAFYLADWEEEAWIALSRAEAAPDSIDRTLLTEVGESLETGREAVRALLLEEIAPTALRDRLYRS